MTEMNTVVAVYQTHEAADGAIKALQRAGLDMKQCSILGKGYHSEEEVVGFYNAGDRMMFWGKQGAFWGGVWGVVLGSGFFVIPGIGPVVAGGALVSAIAGALEGAVVVGGLNILGAGLYSIGIPKDSILHYETAIKANNFLVLYHGTAKEIASAREILSLTQVEVLEFSNKGNVASLP